MRLTPAILLALAIFSVILGFQPLEQINNAILTGYCSRRKQSSPEWKKYRPAVAESQQWKLLRGLSQKSEEKKEPTEGDRCCRQWTRQTR